MSTDRGVRWFILLLLAIGASSSPAEDTSEFSNAVGFQKIVARTGSMVMASVPFGREARTLDAVFGRQLTGGKSQSGSDNVICWNAAEQKYEWYWIRAVDTNWYKAADIPVRATNAFVTTDLGFWLQNRKTTNPVIMVSGDVVDNDVVTNHLLPGMNLVSYPFSQEIDLSKSSLTNAKAGKTEGSADNIYLWDEAIWAYRTYWLCQNDGKWHDRDGLLASNVLVGGGQGFWYRNRRSNTFDWVEARPYTLH